MEDRSIHITVSGPSLTPKIPIMAEIAIALSAAGFDIDIETGELTASEFGKLCYSEEERSKRTHQFRQANQKIFISEGSFRRVDDAHD